jgi:hypothetical protein
MVPVYSRLMVKVRDRVNDRVRVKGRVRVRVRITLLLHQYYLNL